MKFAIPFTKSFKYFNQQQTQININYKPNIKALFDFIKEYSTYRINFIFSSTFEEKDLQIYNTLKENFPNTQLVICYPTYSEEMQNFFVQKKIPHYYKEFVNTYEKLQGFLNLAVTDIFVTEELAFSVNFTSNFTKKKGIQIRSFCNVCEKEFPTTPSLKCFFIRPEDIELYSQYIDVFQFYLPENFSLKKLNILYEIFAIEKKWNGKLKELIFFYTGEEDNRYILPEFGKYRIRCRRKCFSEGDHVCKICNEIADLSKVLKEKNIIIVN